MAVPEGDPGEQQQPRKPMRPLTRRLIILLLLAFILAVLYLGFSPLFMPH